MKLNIIVKKCVRWNNCYLVLVVVSYWNHEWYSISSLCGGFIWS